MCMIVEEYAEEKARKEVLRANRQALIKGFRNGVLTKEAAFVMYPKIKADEMDAIYQEAKKPTRGRRTAKSS